MRLLGPTDVRAVELPDSTRALSTLARVDYHDSFAIDFPGAGERTGEEWFRLFLEGAPPATRRTLRAGWGSLGLRLGPISDPERVLGWEVRSRAPEHALLGANSVLGFEGEVLLERRDEELLFATFIQLRHAGARALWAAVAPGHRRVVRQLLDQVRAGAHRRAARRAQPRAAEARPASR